MQKRFTLTLRLCRIPLPSSGNIYYFIQYPGDTSDIRVTWVSDLSGTEAISELYRSTLVTIAGLTFKNLKKHFDNSIIYST